MIFIVEVREVSSLNKDEVLLTNKLSRRVLATIRMTISIKKTANFYKWNLNSHSYHLFLIIFKSILLLLARYVGIVGVLYNPSLLAF